MFIYKNLRKESFADSFITVKSHNATEWRSIMEEQTYLTDEQLAKKKKWNAVFDKITTALLIFVLATPIMVLAYLVCWFIFR